MRARNIDLALIKSNPEHESIPMIRANIDRLS